MITNIRIRYFKSLKAVNLKLNPVNLVIGANGTGKTNLADAFAFLATAARVSFKEALNDFDGIETVRTRSGVGAPPAFGFEIRIDEDRKRGIVQADYKFRLTNAREPVIATEQMKATVFKRKRGGRRAVPGVPSFDYENANEIGFARNREGIIKWQGETVKDNPKIVDEDALVLSTYGKAGDLRTIADYLGTIKVYNIDAALAKKGEGGSEDELSRYGENLPTFLKKVLEKPKIKGEILDDLREIVPYIKDMTPDKVFGIPTVVFKELDTGSEFLANDISDGTIRILGMLAVLRQPAPPPLVVIEEPENALHQYAIRRLTEVVDELAHRNNFPIQALFTSHSPAVVDEILKLRKREGITAACFVARRERNGSTITAAPTAVMRGIANNIGRPSDFLRENAFRDKPIQTSMEYEIPGSEEE